MYIKIKVSSDIHEQVTVHECKSYYISEFYDNQYATLVLDGREERLSVINKYASTITVLDKKGNQMDRYVWFEEDGIKEDTADQEFGTMRAVETKQGCCAKNEGGAAESGLSYLVNTLTPEEEHAEANKRQAETLADWLKKNDLPA